MTSDETALLIALGSFAVGVALGRLWAHLAGPSRRESKKRVGESIHYILGLDYLASQQTDRAVAELTRAARADTEAIEIYLILGNLLREKGQLERAIQIHQSILHRPGIEPRERAHALLCLGVDFKRAGFRNRALATLQEVASLDPDNPYALMHLMKIHEEDQNWEEALSLQQKVVSASGEANPILTAFLHDQIGLAAAQQKDEKLAARSFEAAIRCNRKLAPPYLHLGDLLERQGHPAEAAAQWETLIRETPEHTYLAFDRLQKLYGKMATPDKLEKTYRQVMERDQKDWRAHFALARKKIGERKTEEALELLLAAAKNNPHAIVIHLELWGLLLDSGAREELIKRYLDGIRGSVFFLDPHVCVKCHYRADGILWRCPHCQEWATFVEESYGIKS